MATRSTMPAVTIQPDLTEVDAAMEFVRTMSMEIRTSRWQDPVLRYAHSQMAQRFDTFMDGFAITNPKSFHHVYEWRMLGQPAGRLWVHKLRGRGGSMEATWEWRPSKTNIPTPQERKAKASPGDPIKFVSDEDIARLSKRKYKFTWKAPVMEYAIPVIIYPVDAKKLFVPTLGARRGYVMVDAASPQNPGGNATTGAFSQAWTAWWNTAAPKEFDTEIKKTVEQHLGMAEREIGKAAKSVRSRKKTFTLSTVGSSEHAFAVGREYALAFMKRDARSYKTAEQKSYWGGV